MDFGKLGVFCLFALLFLAFAYSYEPTEYLAKETQLLEGGETPTTKISIVKGEDEFYVVRITVEGRTSGYIALNKFRKDVVTSEVSNKQLFQTAEFIALYQDFKSDVRDNPSLIWFVVNWGEVGTISNKIANESLELDLIRTSLGGSSANEIVSRMESVLDSIITNLEVLRNKMSSTDALEGSFLTRPAVGGEKEFKDAVIECYSYLGQLHSLNLDYETLQQELAIAIAADPELSVETKQQLNKAADLPGEFSKIESWFTSTQQMQLEKNMNSIYLNASSASSNYAKAIETRFKREAAYNALYGEDPELKKKTGSEYSTLKEAFEGMNSEEQRGRWKKQDELEEFAGEFGRAETRFNSRDYDRSLDSAKKAKSSAAAVYAGGVKEEEPDDFELWRQVTTIAIVIIILLIVLIIIWKREKLRSFISGGEEERVELNEYI